MGLKLKAGDSVTDAIHGTGKVKAVGTNVVAVMFDNGEDGFYAPEADTRIGPQRQLCPIAIQVWATNWKRLPEVYAYASLQGVSVERAIEELVNKGLSHLMP